MAPQGLKPVCVLGAPSPITEQCRVALREYATVQPQNLASLPTSDWALILLVLPRALDEAVRLFSQVRTEEPATPVILLGSSMDADTAVELIKCGADDYLSLPLDGAVLARKVKRAIGSFEGPAFDRPELSPLERNKKPKRNRRHCFRVSVADELGVGAQVRSVAGSVGVAVLNLSIKTEGWLGGLLLEFAPKSLELLPKDLVREGRPLPLTLELADDGEAIPLRARVVLGGIRARDDGSRLVAVQYQSRGPQDESRLRELWLDAQRPQRRRDSASSALGDGALGGLARGRVSWFAKLSTSARPARPSAAPRSAPSGPRASVPPSKPVR